jgi:hypothetical protein
MSKYGFSRRHSFRKSIKPIFDIDENEDDQRRDTFGRKRVDVIQCLLESSSDDSNDETVIIDPSSRPILWLTFAEICHIRTVLAQTILSTLLFTSDKQYSKIIHGDICFRCRAQIRSFFSLPSFLFSTTSFTCYICQQRFCRKCSVSNFFPPLLKHSFPVRLKTLIKTTSIPIENEMNNESGSSQQRKTICYDCSQVKRSTVRDISKEFFDISLGIQ